VAAGTFSIETVVPAVVGLMWRYMDKLVDEVARGKKMSAILRGGESDAI